jgi:nitrogen fixation protein NifU and related proteins
MTDALYHALIVEHDRSPRNEGPLPDATHSATLDNPLCGDTVTIRIVIEGKRVVDAKFEARGCALCRAAASMMTTRVIGARLDEVHALIVRFDELVGGQEPDALGELVAFRGVQSVRSRRTCATLPFRALAKALLER